MISTRRLFCVLLLLLFLPSVAVAAAPVEGKLSILWGDPHPQSEERTQRQVLLAEDDGTVSRLRVSDELLAGGVLRWNDKRVRVFPAEGANARAEKGLAVQALRLLEGGEALGGVAGSQPWISILCKFSDIADEPRNLSYFQNMYANAPSGLDHYWREVSGDAIDVVGSTAVDWVTLPGTQVSYVPTPGSGTTADLGRVFQDCTAAVDDFVDFSNGGTPYVGINLMVNGSLDCCAWGGGRFATLDGISKTWRTTWNPPWAFNNSAVIAHEMGHGFGLPHANNFDGDNNPYDSPWDVMSAATAYSVADATYGAQGKHINAYHKDRLGWFPENRRFVAPADSLTPILLDHTAYNEGIAFQVAVIPIDATRWYTVEARQRSGDYEMNLPGDAVIIHEVNTARSEPAWAVDGDVPPADFSDNDGTMWTVGETFVDEDHSISVSVDLVLATGFGVTIRTGDPGQIFSDGFESGEITDWLLVSP